MDEKRYDEVCQLLASYVTFPLEGISVGNVLFHIVRRMTVCNDEMRGKVKDYVKQWIETQNYSVASIDVEEHLDCAMHVYDTVFYEGNQCA